MSFHADNCQYDQILAATLNEKTQGQSLELEVEQELKELDYQLVDILAVLCSTSDTISLMMQKYKKLCCDCCDPMKRGSDIELDSLYVALEEKQTEVRLNMDKIRSLSAKINGLETLVSKMKRYYTRSLKLWKLAVRFRRRICDKATHRRSSKRKDDNANNFRKERERCSGC